MPKVKLNRKDIVEAIRTAEHQSDALISLYRMVFPDWDRIRDIEGWPAVSDDTWRALAREFITLDEKLHPEVLPGGLWMNKGFSTGPDLPGWTVDLDGVKVEYNKE